MIIRILLLILLSCPLLASGQTVSANDKPVLADNKAVANDKTITNVQPAAAIDKANANNKAATIDKAVSSKPKSESTVDNSSDTIVLVSINTAVEPKGAITLADDIELTLTIHVQRGVQLSPVTPPAAWGAWQVVGTQMEQSSPDIHVLKIVLRPSKLGSLTIPAWPIYFTDDLKRPGCCESKEIVIEVKSNIASDDMTLNGLQSNSKLLAIKHRLIPIIMILLALLVVSVLVWSALHKRRKEHLKATVQTPQQWAAEQLQKLLESNLAQQDVKQFYIKLTLIVRHFIEQTTLINAPELTTEEFLHKISSGQVFSDVERMKLKQFLEQADMVKFAKYEPGEASLRSAVHSAEVFIGIVSDSEET